MGVTGGVSGDHGRRTPMMMVGMVVLLVATGAPAGAFAAAPGTSATQEPADLVILNAALWTGAETVRPEARGRSAPTAVAVRDRTIAAVGDADSVRPFVGPDTKVIDAAGRRVIPGMTDSHTHIIGGGLQLARLALREVRGREEFVAAVEASAKTKGPGQWLLGGRWSVESWSQHEPPTKAWLDPVTNDVPVFLTRMDGHQALVNSAALRLAGIDANGPKDPVGGEIERDYATGEPTGVLKESAMDLVSRHIPEPAAEQRYQALLQAMKHANALGVTSVHDMSSPSDLAIFRQALADDALSVRITSYVHYEDWLTHTEEVIESGLDDRMVRVVGFKGYMDGSLGSRTAFMGEPYADAAAGEPYPRGQLTEFAQSEAAFRDAVAKVDALGLQMAVHAIGDQANHLLLNAYERAALRNKRGDARHRVEHAQHLLVADIPRFARLGVTASMQPYHKADDGRYAEAALGTARLAGSYAFRRLLDAGVLLCFGSDWPVVTMNPFAGIDSAVNARTLADEVWLASHSITIEEALRAYTVSPARAVHREGRLGTIEVGKLSDLVILADDPLTMPRERLGEVQVDMTIVGGRVVFSRPTDMPPGRPSGR